MAVHKKRIGKKKTFYEIEQKIDNVINRKTTKMIVDFCAEESASFKFFAIKKITKARSQQDFYLEKC